jgi:hypothetical protein
MKYRERSVEFAHFHVGPSEQLFANARRVGCLRKISKKKHEGCLESRASPVKSGSLQVDT